MSIKQKKKVLVCMSGGVDSSVAALLLVQAGYEVTGAYMKQWSDSKGLSGVCSWKDDRRDALRVAAHLAIPLLTLDFEKEYRKWVVKYMFDEYRRGRTPNPDVMCNKYVKFGFWMKKARELGFDYLATGHYAQLHKVGKVLKLLEGKDKEKDQTYFLHQLGQEQLSHTLFPIGHLKKSQVRAMAKKNNLPTAERAESMGICFIGEVPMKEFLQQKIKPKKGQILNTVGEKIGEHEGLPFYTIGQRHGFSQAGGTEPLFVVGKNMKKNELIVGLESDPALYKKEIRVENMHFVSGQAPKFPLQCEVRMRHRQSFQKVLVTPGKKTKTVILAFQKLQKAVTPGQFAVLYKDGECLGGGVIE
jgi:tRNA-specific 2-thiouridylase